MFYIISTLKVKIMKKVLFLLPLLALSSVGLSACRTDKKARITYGTLVDNEVTEILYSTLKTKMVNKENLLLAVYQDSPQGMSCGCWRDFKAVLNEYVNEYKTKIYIIARSQFASDDETFGLTLLDSSETTSPTFALMKNGKKTNEYIYANDTKPMFTKLKDLRTAITKIARDPQYMLINEEFLDDALFTTKVDKAVVHYIWNFCPDCLDCFPNVLVPYSEKNVFNTTVWIIDLGIPGILLDGEGNWVGTGSATYVEFLKKHKMSAAGDETFGYDRGFVPTTQVWEKGELKDATTYFNDTVVKEGDTYKISQSFYSAERIKSLSYTDQVIEERVLAEEEVTPKYDDNGNIVGYTWAADYARKVHQPLLEAFLDKYVK